MLFGILGHCIFLLHGFLGDFLFPTCIVVHVECNVNTVLLTRA